MTTYEINELIREHGYAKGFQIFQERKRQAEAAAQQNGGTVDWQRVVANNRRHQPEREPGEEG